ncbi:MAG TPA: glycosyltransferase, partial [Burkholderiales bacterium]
LAAKLQLGERVRFAGNQADVVPWLQAFDVFVLPSYANEGVPQALVQAMLTGLPCVTTTVGSISELAKDDETALVVPPREVAPLRAAILRLLMSPETRARLGEAARKHCEAGFSYEAMLDKMERIYKNLIS